MRIIRLKWIDFDAVRLSISFVCYGDQDLRMIRHVENVDYWLTMKEQIKIGKQHHIYDLFEYGQVNIDLRIGAVMTNPHDKIVFSLFFSSEENLSKPFRFDCDFLELRTNPRPVGHRSHRSYRIHTTVVAHYNFKLIFEHTYHQTFISYSLSKHPLSTYNISLLCSFWCSFNTFA